MPRLHLYGPPRATLPGAAPLPLAAREAALLARLWLDGAAPRAALAGWLWPAADERRSRANLRQTLLRLRRALGEVFDEADGVLALAAGVEVDAGAGRLLGPLEFDDAPELAAWLDERRARVQRERLREGLRTAQAHLAACRWHEALASADAVLADDAAIEEAHRLRMAVFLGRGDRAAAIAAWDACRDALRAAYGIAPGPETNELGRRILAAAAADSASTAPSGMSGVPADAARAAGRVQAPLVGRASALARLHAALAAGRAVLVAGPGGIGKSRLLDAALAGRDDVVRTGARPADEHLPGVLASRLVAALLPRVGDGLDGAARDALRRLRPPGADGAAAGVLPPMASARELAAVFDAFTQLLRAARAGGVATLVIDDLQFADALSLEALAVAVGAWLGESDGPDGPGGGAGALPGWVFAARPDELPPAAARWLARLEGSLRGERIVLAPLAAADLEALLAARPAGPAEAMRLPALNAALDPALHPALAAALLARVGGNPAFVLEALRGLDDAAAAGRAWQPGEALPVPANLLDALRQRLAGLGDDALRLAQLAAVAGADFSLPLAAAAFDRAPIALAPLFAELEAAQVLAGAGFVHDLVADAVAHSVPASLRAPLHALVAEHLAARGGAAARIARHRLAAGDRAGAAAGFLQAAQQARERWQMADAAEAFGSAAEALDGERARPQRLRAWRDAARCWLNAGDAQRAEAALDAAAPLARGEREQLLLRSARLTLSLNTGRHGDLAATARWLAGALPRHEAALDEHELTHTLLGVAAAAPYVDEPAALLALVDTLAARGAADARLAARIELSAGMLLNWLARPAEARERLLQADRIAARHDVGGERVNAGNQLARADELLGELAGASRRCLETGRIARELGVGANFEADLLNLRGLLEAALGRAEPAREAFADATRLLGPGAAAGGYMRVREALALLRLGDADAAEACFATIAEPAGDDAHSAFNAHWCWVRAHLDAAAGRPVAAWLDRAAPSCRHPEGLLGLRQRVMRALYGVGGDGAVRSEPTLALARYLRQRGLPGLAAVLEPVGDKPADPWCAPVRRR